MTPAYERISAAWAALAIGLAREARSEDPHRRGIMIRELREALARGDGEPGERAAWRVALTMILH